MEEAIRACFDRRRDAERAAVQVELFKQQAPCLFEEAVCEKLGLAAEEVAEARRNEDCNRPMHIGGEPQPFGLLANPRRSRQHALRAGIERQC